MWMECGKEIVDVGVGLIYMLLDAGLDNCVRE